MIDLTELVSKVNGGIRPQGDSTYDKQVLENIENLGDMLCNYISLLNGIKLQNENSYENSVIKCVWKIDEYLNEIREILGDE